jgi:DNA-binding SARP family transcriptional activator
MSVRAVGGGNPETTGPVVDQSFFTPLHLERFLYGLVLVERGGRVIYVNRRARQLLMPGQGRPGQGQSRCCDLICDRIGPLLGGGCVSEQVAASTSLLPEVRMDIEHARAPQAAWVSAAWWGATNEQLLFHLRPGSPGDRRRRAAPGWVGRTSARRCELQISVLRPFAVEATRGPIGGRWVDQRPGQLLKYLVSQRGRAICGDQIAEAMWPGARPEIARNRLRFYVHALREKLEPDRGHRSTCRFLVARNGGYQLDTSDVWIDADEFEREAQAGLAAFAHDQRAAADEHLKRAMGLYRAPFLAEEPYADWALEERERLQELAAAVLRSRLDLLATGSGDLEALAGDARRFAEMEPFDTDAQRMVIALCLRRGRRSEAMRRYAALRKRMLENFGEEPDFDLTDLGPGRAPDDGLTARASPQVT